MYEIETDINIPKKKRTDAGTSQRFIALSALKVGDSFVFDRRANKAHPVLRKYCIKLGIKIRARAIDDSSCRVWRVE